MAADAIATELLARRGDITLAYLATPTDVFMVPMDAVEESRRRWDARGLSGILQSPLRLLKQFEPNYKRDVRRGRRHRVRHQRLPRAAAGP